MSTQPPPALFRYRPLSKDVLERELSALRDSYLYAPLFCQMNDPMEAFYETGGALDDLAKAMLPQSAGGLDAVYTTLRKQVDKFALVSFSATAQDLPLWAYYASNFAGMCLEFDTARLPIGGFKNEELGAVSYASDPLPALTMADLAGGATEKALLARITRKRSEWAHEKEWRYVVGEAGPRRYVDSALRRVLLGPRIPAEHAQAICETVAGRAVEVVQGRVHGYTLTFETIQAATPAAECERVGKGHFNVADHSYLEPKMLALLSVPLDALWEACRHIATDPNLDSIDDVSYSSSHQGLLFVQARYLFRDGTKMYHNHYFDSELRARREASA